MIRITGKISIAENEIQEDFSRASGPGGQNVNKVATAVQLRFDVLHSSSLPEEVRERLRQIARRRISAEGLLLISAGRYRSQKANREDAMQRLVELVRKAAQKPLLRKKTRPTYSAQMRRLKDKQHRSRKKRERFPAINTED